VLKSITRALAGEDAEGRWFWLSRLSRLSRLYEMAYAL
jgi:hypothetical protein